MEIHVPLGTLCLCARLKLGYRYTVDGMKLYFANLALLCVFALKFFF